MPRDRVELVRQYFEAWGRGEFDADPEDLDPGVTIDWEQSHAPYAGKYAGAEGWRRLFEELQESWGDARAEPDEYVVAGPHVAVKNTAYMRGRDGIEVSARSTIVFTFRGDRITDVRLFQDHADALKAIGAG